MSAFLTATPLLTSKRAAALAVNNIHSSRQFNHVIHHKRAIVVQMQLDLGNDFDSDVEDVELGHEERKLFVGNLHWDTTKDSLGDAFSIHGTVLDAHVVRERDTGRSRGFGFVEFEEPASATVALNAMNGAEIDGRAVRVDRANRRPQRRRPRENYY